ncbi:MAG TPA: hypothetical protein VL832_05340 [Puia sp.]|jgi:hypothetical protein|nr:hypothetical protein [Puia sp.]
METIYSSFQAFQLGLLQVLITGIILFALGFWVGGALKSKKLLRKMARMERKIRDLNSELLYNRTS